MYMKVYPHGLLQRYVLWHALERTLGSPRQLGLWELPRRVVSSSRENHGNAGPWLLIAKWELTLMIQQGLRKYCVKYRRIDSHTSLLCVECSCFDLQCVQTSTSLLLRFLCLSLGFWLCLLQVFFSVVSLCAAWLSCFWFIQAFFCFLCRKDFKYSASVPAE